MNLKRWVPWRAKIVAKIILSCMPVQYAIWRRFDLFMHGEMKSPEYACGVLTSHMRRLGWKNLQGKVVLVLGSGDSLSSALVASTFGATKIYLVDVGPYADQQMDPYRALYEDLVKQDLQPPDIRSCQSTSDLLAVCCAEYLTRGVESLKQIPSVSVDFLFSQAVLEHVRLRDVPATLREIRRVISASGIASHQVDLKDHLGGGLNNLRFSYCVWEAEFMARSGFYTNRLRYSEILNLPRETGCEPEVVEVKCWDRLPTVKTKLAARFRHLPEEELLVSRFDVIVRSA